MTDEQYKVTARYGFGWTDYRKLYSLVDPDTPGMNNINPHYQPKQNPFNCKGCGAQVLTNVCAYCGSHK